MVRLVFLGKFRPLAPSALEAAEPPKSITRLHELRDWVMDQAPALGAAMAATSVKVIVNQAMIHDMAAAFHAGDEIAFMPPMSGG